MPVTMSNNFKAAKNAQTATPIWLFRIGVDSDPTHDLFLTDWNSDVSYFKEDNGIFTAQVYTRYPIKHGGIASNKSGRIDSIEVSVANVDLNMQYYLEQKDALRGRRVVVWQTFLETLGNPADHIEDVAYIDSATSNEQTVTFSLAGKLDLGEMHLPKQMYFRDYCPHTYKGQGCWIANASGGYDPPGKFDTSWTMIRAAETGAFIDQNPWAGTSFVQSKTSFVARDITGFGNNPGDSVYCEFYATGGMQYLKDQSALDVDKFAVWLYLYDTNGQAITINVRTLLLTGVYQGGWQGLTFDRSACAIAPTFDYFNVAGAEVTAMLKNNGKIIDNRLYLSVRNVKVKRVTPYSFIGDDDGSGPHLDRCLKSLAECRRHNNVLRFGGFPTIPRQRVFHVG